MPKFKQGFLVQEHETRANKILLCLYIEKRGYGYFLEQHTINSHILYIFLHTFLVVFIEENLTF